MGSQSSLQYQSSGISVDTLHKSALSDCHKKCAIPPKRLCLHPCPSCPAEVVLTLVSLPSEQQAAVEDQVQVPVQLRPLQAVCVA